MQEERRRDRHAEKDERRKQRHEPAPRREGVPGSHFPFRGLVEKRNPTEAPPLQLPQGNEGFVAFCEVGGESGGRPYAAYGRAKPLSGTVWGMQDGNFMNILISIIHIPSRIGHGAGKKFSF